MHFSRRLKQGSVGRERTSDDRLFQANMFLKKILEMSSTNDFKGFFTITLYRRRLGGGVCMVNTVEGSKGVRSLKTF
jgi:hypothetical protein